MKKNINIIKVSLKNRKVNPDKVKELADSILKIGLINPITITSNNTLIAGQHRLEACKSLDYSEIECNVIESEDKLQIDLIQIDENLIRNDLTVLEQCDMLNLRKKIYETMYPETKHGKNQFTRGLPESGTPFSHESFVSNTSLLTNKSKSKISEEIQISKSLSSEVKEKILDMELANQKSNLLELSKLDTKLQLEVISELEKNSKKSVKEALQDIRNFQKIDNRKILINELKSKINIDFESQINKKYQAIVIDPPWGKFEDNSGMTCEGYNSEFFRGTPPYPTMSLTEIEQIKLPADDDCVLFLWAIQASLPYAYEILKKWGFHYKATLVWNKETMGLGKAIRFQIEFCLMGFKGSPIVNSGSETDFISEKRREHSRKPEAFYQFVDRYVVGKKLDYFAREIRPGWDTYGVESDKFSYTEKSIVG